MNMIRVIRAPHLQLFLMRWCFINDLKMIFVIRRNTHISEILNKLIRATGDFYVEYLSLEVKIF